MIIPVVFSTDHNFIMPTGVAILSLLEQSNDCNPYIYVLQSDDVSDSDRDILKSICNRYSAPVDFISFDDTFKNSFEIRGITTATYYRLLIPWLMPEYEKVIYCDGDVIFNRSVSNIYNFPIGDCYIAGVQTGFRSHTSTGSYIESLGLDINQYINGGVLLINLKQQREANLRKVYMAEAEKRYVFQDQDIINIVCKGHIRLMPRWFNTTPNAVNDMIFNICEQGKCSVLSDRGNSPVIIHYAGGKPWKEFTYWWLSWWQAYSKSPFFDPALEFQIERRTLTKDPQLRPALSLYIRRKIPFLGRLIDKIR